MAELWHKAEQLSKKINLLEDGSQQLNDVPTKGSFIIETKLVRQSYHANYRMRISHLSSCKVKILKVSYTSKNSNGPVLESNVGLEVNGDGPHLTAVYDSKTANICSSYIEGTLKIDLQMGKTCSCHVCILSASYERLLLSTDSSDVIIQVGDVEIS